MGTLIVKNVKHFLVFSLKLVLRGEKYFVPPPPFPSRTIVVCHQKLHENSLWEIFKI